jgi:hypothetical protein
MKRHVRYRYIRIAVAAAIAILATMPASPAAYADVARTGREPWYQQSTADARRQAQALFEQALDKHLQLLRGDAMELYERALALWDNPDIRWNLALVLDDLGKHVAAHEQLESALRWEAELGAARTREIRDRMHALEVQRLARIEALSQEPGAEIKLDGQPWFRDAGRETILVSPGTHYIASSKPGYTPTTVSVAVAVGERYRVRLRMVANDVVEVRRWSRWKPWTVVALGTAVAAVGIDLERRSRAHRSAAANALAKDCPPPFCEPTRSPDIYDRAVLDSRLATGAFAAGGITVAVGLALAWLNQPRPYHPEAPASPVELIPTLSPGSAGVSARVRF